MTQEQFEQLLVLAQTAGGAAYQAALQRVYANAIIGIIFFAALLIGATWLMRYAMKRTPIADGENEHFSVRMIGGLMYLMVSAVCWGAIVFDVIDLFSPHFAALERLANLVTGV